MQPPGLGSMAAPETVSGATLCAAIGMPKEATVGPKLDVNHRRSRLAQKQEPPVANQGSPMVG